MFILLKTTSMTKKTLQNQNQSMPLTKTNKQNPLRYLEEKTKGKGP